jgi:hypothetical protein
VLCARSERIRVWSCPSISSINRKLNNYKELQITVLWDVTQCSPTENNRRFGRTCCLDLQSRKVIRERENGYGETNNKEYCFLGCDAALFDRK